MHLRIASGREHVSSIITQSVSDHHGIWLVDFKPKYLEMLMAGSDTDGIEFVEFRASEHTPERPDRYDKENLAIRFELVDVPSSIDEEIEVNLWVLNGYATRYTGWITAVDTGYNQRVEVLG